MQQIIDELDDILAAEDEPDFCHSMTAEAYGLARELIESAYTCTIGDVPTPAAAPDGDGGLVVEWKAGKTEVRLIAAPDKARRSYIYSRGMAPARVDYELSGDVLAAVLRERFGR